LGKVGSPEQGAWEEGRRVRTVTESSHESEYGWMEGLEPLTLDDLTFTPPCMDGEEEVCFDPTASGRLFSAVRRVLGRRSRKVSTSSPAKQRWRRAVQLVRQVVVRVVSISVLCL